MLAQLTACKHTDTVLNTKAEPLIQKAFKPEGSKAGVQMRKVTTLLALLPPSFLGIHYGPL